jgi:hypothetical protein
MIASFKKRAGRASVECRNDGGGLVEQAIQ